MTSFMQRSAKHFVLIKAVRQIKQEIEKAGLDNLKILAENGRSIVGTYLNGCSPQEKAIYKRDLNALLQMGITPDTLLGELARQMPDLAPTMEGKDDYKKSEIQNFERFLKEG
ncbi:hypothetical protein ES703_82228 [subsurface metagenome]